MTTHLIQDGGKSTACGIDRGGEGFIRWTIHKHAVTCVDCQLTPMYAKAIQRLPTFRGGPYRHANYR